MSIPHKENVYRRSFSFTLEGDPVPLARARMGNHKLYDGQKHIKNVARTQLLSQFNNTQQFTGPLHVHIEFFFQIPKQHKIGEFHHTRPDISNCVKFVEDIMNGIVFPDDCLIASLTSKKTYDEKPLTEFYIMEL